jgi:hypothetical protein
LNPELAIAAAKNYRLLRSEGITIRDLTATLDPTVSVPL